MKSFTFSSRRIISAIALAAVVCGSTLVSAPASASVESDRPGSPFSRETATALERAIDASTDVFDGARAVHEGAPKAVIDDFATGWAAAGNRTTNAVVNVAILAAIQEALPTLRACSGKNHYDYTGLQLNVYLSSCNTQRIAGLLTAAGGVTSAAAAIAGVTGVGLVVAGAFAGALALAGGILTICSARGRGVVIHNIPPGPVTWCNGQ